MLSTVSTTSHAGDPSRSSRPRGSVALAVAASTI
jgi:hypothetical protein